MSEPIFTRHTGAQTVAMLDALAELYLEVRRDDFTHDDPLFSRPSFVSRTTNQAGRTGFELLTATVDGALAGFSFGYPIAAGGWWADATPPPEQILKASKFAVIELDVGRSYQGQGLGRALLAALLDERPETYATLATIAESPAHAMYERWGWFVVGTIGGEGPVMDALVLPGWRLPGHSGSSWGRTCTTQHDDVRLTLHEGSKSLDPFGLPGLGLRVQVLRVRRLAMPCCIPATTTSSAPPFPNPGQRRLRQNTILDPSTQMIQSDARHE